MSEHVAEEKKPAESHLHVTTSVALRKQKQMKKSEVSKIFEWLNMSEENKCPQLVFSKKLS